MNLSTIRTVFLSLFFIFSASLQANDSTIQIEQEEPAQFSEEIEEINTDGFDPKALIMHHIKDAYGFHIMDIGERSISIPLPVILWTDNGFTVFMSSEFDHDYKGKVVVNKNGGQFVNFHEKVYQLDANAEKLVLGEDGYPVNAQKPIDISITKNVFMMFISMLILIWLFTSAARAYRRSKDNVPSGAASFLEPLVLFVRDDIAIPNIGEKNHARFMPYLLTIFFFIWLNNLLGLIPVFSAANVSGNIAFTLVLATFTFLVTNFSGNKDYWKHIFWMPGVPVPMKIFLMPIELVGIFVKPISLMIRLFANITAGHIIILSLMSLIFIFQTIAVAPVSVAFAIFIGLIEIVVTAMQAYIFTMLSALYIGMATAEHEHH